MGALHSARLPRQQARNQAVTVVVELRAAVFVAKAVLVPGGVQTGVGSG